MATHSARLLNAPEISRRCSLPHSTADVDDMNDLGALIDREKHAINVRAATVVEDANRLIRVEAFRCYPVSLWECLERRSRSFETVEPGRALA
jgi:hypothetical protein